MTTRKILMYVGGFVVVLVLINLASFALARRAAAMDVASSGGATG